MSKEDMTDAEFDRHMDKVHAVEERKERRIKAYSKRNYGEKPWPAPIGPPKDYGSGHDMTHHGEGKPHGG